LIDLDAIRVRLLTPQDQPQVEDFYARIGGESRAFFNHNDCSLNFTLRYLRGEEPNGRFYMAEHEGRMVGTMFLWDVDKRIPWLGIALAEELKGRHYGRTLLRYAHEEARKLGAGGVLLTTAVANIRGQALYERMGYERMGQHSGGEFLYLLRFPVEEPTT
jgi:ribosomal protein S18 acetylase RimI-like enzyme